MSVTTALALVLASCGGGGVDNSGSPAATPPASPPPSTVYTPPAQLSLSVADVQTVIAQAASEAQARNKPAVIAVTDRVGNVLALFNMNGAPPTALTTPAPAAESIDIQNQRVPAVAAAISKAVTGAYLSSGGNAFSTRTASQIVQEHFPPAPSTVGLESGPLYGVQFSSLPCSDLNTRFIGVGQAALIGPKRAPLGLAADSGGFPLYKNGVLVGGIGVMADGSYGFDTNILDVDSDDEEFIALAGTIGFDAPATIRAERITVDGTSLRYSDATPAGFSRTGAAPTFAAVNGTLGTVVGLRGYADPIVIAGVAYGSELSGVRASTAAEFPNRDAFILTDGSGTNRFPVRGGTDTANQPLTATEARILLEEAFTIMSRARAQIRQPLDSRAQVTISLVDTNGAVLGIVRAPDAPIFGTDVSLQKARTVMFFSNASAAGDLGVDINPEVRAYVPRFRTFLNDPAALTGTVAYANRSVGNLERPFFPDGEVARPPGPLSPAIDQFNPFATGLQSALIANNLVAHVLFLQGTIPNDTPQRCTFIRDAAPGQNRLQNGLQIFPGGVPIYRGSRLVGGIGVSGDGIDQDDMISFLGASNGGARAGTGIGNADPAIRADTIVVPLSNSPGVRLRYVSCPFAPFLDSSEQNVCQGR